MKTQTHKKKKEDIIKMCDLMIKLMKEDLTEEELEFVREYFKNNLGEDYDG